MGKLNLFTAKNAKYEILISHKVFKGFIVPIFNTNPRFLIISFISECFQPRKDNSLRLESSSGSESDSSLCFQNLDIGF